MILKETIFSRFFFLFIGNGLLSATGDDHRYQKTFFKKLFSASQIKHYVTVVKKLVIILEKLHKINSQA